MIVVRRNSERHYEKRGRREVWTTFGSGTGPGTADGFGALETIDECRLPPGATLRPQPKHAAEVVTCVREGALAYEDSTGRSGIIQAGEVRRTTTGRGLRQGESNASRTDFAHVFHVRLQPSENGFAPGQEQKRFSAAERRAGLCVLASPDSRGGSLRIHQNACLYSAILDPGKHEVHALADGRMAWLHVVEGEVTLGDVVLATGDGAGLTSELAVSLTAREPSEILLVDLREYPSKPSGKGRPS